MGYPDDLTGRQLCHMEGCMYPEGKATCSRCYKVNRPLAGWIGWVTRKAGEWNLTWQAAENRLNREWLIKTGCCPDCGAETHAPEPCPW